MTLECSGCIRPAAEHGPIIELREQVRMVGRFLDTVFRTAGILAGIFLALIAVLILAQIAGRLFGFLIPSADEFAGFSMAASTFLALAYALRHGDHIRVSLLIGRLGVRSRWIVEIWCSALATLCLGYFAFHAVEMAWESHLFGDVAQGLIKTPLWIPQSAMALGLCLMTLAFAEDFIRTLRGAAPRYEAADPAISSDAG